MMREENGLIKVIVLHDSVFVSNGSKKDGLEMTINEANVGDQSNTIASSRHSRRQTIQSSSQQSGSSKVKSRTPDQPLQRCSRVEP